MVYVGLSYYGPALGSEEHLSFLFSSLAEIPSYMACWVVMDRWGRRWPLCLCMVVAGVSCIATVLLSPGNSDSHRSMKLQSTLTVGYISPFLVQLSSISSYRRRRSHVDPVSPIEVRDIGLLSDHISLRR